MEKLTLKVDDTVVGYASSVMVDEDLPDAEDGEKPSGTFPVVLFLTDHLKEVFTDSKPSKENQKKPLQVEGKELKIENLWLTRVQFVVPAPKLTAAFKLEWEAETIKE